jgi:hypothetical protein
MRMSSITLYCKNIFYFLEEDGQWMPNINTKYNIKSFGVYQCSCSRIWGSAHARSNYKQACKKCGKFNFPVLLWKDDHKKIKQIGGNTKEHETFLCEFCIINGREYCVNNVPVPPQYYNNPLPPLLPLPSHYYKYLMGHSVNYV